MIIILCESWVNYIITKSKYKQLNCTCRYILKCKVTNWKCNHQKMALNKKCYFPIFKLLALYQYIHVYNTLSWKTIILITIWDEINIYARITRIIRIINCY